MAASTNIFTVTVRQQDSGGVDVLGSSGRTFTYTFAGSVGEYVESQSIPTSATTITLPIATVSQLFIQNLDATNYVTVTWTPNGGSSNVVKNIKPGGFIAFDDLDVTATAGITALSLQANTAACKVRMFLGG